MYCFRRSVAQYTALITTDLSSCMTFPNMGSTHIETKHPSVTVHPLSKRSNSAWEQMKQQQKVVSVDPIALDSPIYSNSIRFVCISDTHSFTSRMMHAIPPGDVLLHAGDFTRGGALREVSSFNDFLGSLRHRYKVVIAGNHELTFDPTLPRRAAAHGAQAAQNELASQAKRLLTNCIYLEDQEVSVYGVKIYGSPWYVIVRGRSLQ